MKFLCWDDDNQDRSEAREVEAADQHRAAEEFAEWHYSMNAGDEFDSVDVHVELVDLTSDAQTWKICVNVTMEPVFTAESST